MAKSPTRALVGGTKMGKDGKIKISKKKEKSVRVLSRVGATHVSQAQKANRSCAAAAGSTFWPLCCGAVATRGKSWRPRTRKSSTNCASLRSSAWCVPVTASASRSRPSRLNWRAVARSQLSQFDEMRINNGGTLTDREQGYQAYYAEELTFLQSDDSMDWLKKCMGVVLKHTDIEHYHKLDDKAVRSSRRRKPMCPPPSPFFFLSDCFTGALWPTMCAHSDESCVRAGSLRA